MARHYLVDDQGPFLRITLNRARGGNMVTSRAMREIAGIVSAVRTDGPFRAVVLRGKGPDFCLGRDTTPGPGGPAKTAWQAHEAVMGPILGVYEAFRKCPVPVIAAIQGRAIGFGSGMVAGADLSICDAAARFALPEMNSGIPPTLVITAFANVHRKAVADLVYSCREVDAETALAIGLVGRIAPAGTLDAVLDDQLAALERYDAIQIQVVKRFLGKPGTMDPDALSDLAGYTLATAFTRPR